MSVNELLKEGKLQEAITALSGELRNDPGNNRSRTFLFELLCFAGDYSRAEKHLTMLSDESPDTAIGALLYRSAVNAERKRQAFFEAKAYLDAPPSGARHPGKLNGEAFQTIQDIDPRMGPRLEAFVAGEYVWIPFAHIGTLTMAPPRYLRDLLWPSVTIVAGPAMQGKEFGEVLAPALYPFSCTHERDTVKLGRETDFVLAEEDPLEIPFGQKLLVLDGDRFVSILEVRSLEFDDAAPPSLPS